MKTLPFVSAMLMTAAAQFACSSSSLGIHDAGAGEQPGVGGSVASGGVPGLGGSVASGGISGTGGSVASGGIPGAGGVTSSGGKSGTGGVLGSGGMTSLGGSGGAGGNACLDSSGNVSTAVKSCVTDGDCTTATIRTCCGSDLAVGLAKTASCTFPTPNCSGLGCAKMLYPRAEDGVTADANSAVTVRCSASLCNSFVVWPPGAGGASGAGSTSGAGGTGGVIGSGGATSMGGATGSGGATGLDASTGDASTGACTTDSDCVFRANAGCCGKCLAVSDPVPPTIPCGAACSTYTTCACVNGQCAVGTLPVNSSCQTSHDLCQVNTKCCTACGPRLPDGGIGCAAPVCTQVVSSSAGVGCPLTG